MNRKLIIHICIAAEIPKYKELYKIISEEIGNCKVERPALVSWLSPEQRMKAKSELKNHLVPPFKLIKDPSKLTELKYPIPNFKFFDGDAEKVKNHDKTDDKSGKWTLSMKDIKMKWKSTSRNK